jgi:Trk K+ transport system NAD-binding subunit
VERENATSVQDVLLVGYGSESRRIVSALADRARFIIVERNQAVAAQARKAGHAVIEGDASDVRTLRAARVEAVELVAITANPLDEAIVRAIRRRRPEGVILTQLSPGYDNESTDGTARMISRMSRILDFAGQVTQ